MKTPVIAVFLLLSMGGCATTSPTAPPSSSSSIVSEIQSKARQVCGFVPTVQTVASIVASFTGGSALVDYAGSVAGAICQAVTTNPLADGPGAKNYKPKVNGVRVRGQFVR